MRIVAAVLATSVIVAMARTTRAAEPIEVYVWGQQPASTASEQTIRQRDFELRPSSTPSDILRLVPGLVIAQHAGGGKADQIFLRGFDADHGTDVAIFVDGIPVNMVSHAHGQGYADLHWLIPEIVDHVEVYKGPYFVQFGDIATAGAVNIVTKRRDKDTTLTIMGGSFDTQRYLGILSPPEGTPLTPYIAFEAYHNNGPFKNPNNLNRFNIFSKFSLLSTASSNLSLLGTFFKSYWNASGQIPAREVRAGRLGRFDSEDSSEGGKTERQNLNLVYNYADARQSFNAQVWTSWYRLNLFSDFTFFLNDPINGDGIEQEDKRFLGGSYFNYRRNYTFFDIATETLVGFSSRTDRATVGLFTQMKRHRLDTTRKSFVNQTNLAWYAQQEFRPTSWLRAQIGARLDKFFFDVHNLGGTATPISGTDEGFIANPKVNIILSPFSDNAWAKRSEIYVNFGGGYHSNDARDVVSSTGNKPVLPRILGGELGFRTKLLDRLDVGLAYWRSHLESELVFVGDEGTTEPRGKTQRQGVEGEFRYQILDWLSADLDISYTWSKFVKTGDAIPLAPRFLALTGLTARHSSGLEGRIQLRSVGDRYGTEDRTVNIRGYNIVDLNLKYKWDRYEFLFAIDNIANKKWRAAQFVFESQLRGEPAPVLDRHFTPGDPFTVRAGVTVHFELPKLTRP
ncbi:MAG TPA: TonB-dependent receptor [Methylomirabilota bacterium]|nr:TonB-dependent receptor [Methylomirabilota bacterium]